MKQLKKAFTLVELIVVIVIIAILATIAFISLKDYPKDARDTVRKANMKSIETVLSLYEIKNGGLPLPDNSETQSGWINGEFGTGVLSKVKNISTLPTDPLTGEYYTYKLSEDGEKFQILGKLENGEIYMIEQKSGGISTTNDDGGVNSVQNPSTIATFSLVTDNPLGTVDQYYVQSNTNLKWEKTTSSSSMTWANNNSYREPIWNGSSYDYPSGRNENDYPAFKYCTNKGAGWRLPTKNEFWSIITDKASDKNSHGYYTKLEAVSTTRYCSSTESAPRTDNAWRADFSSGYLTSSNRATFSYVICIHD